MDVGTGSVKCPVFQMFDDNLYVDDENLYYICVSFIFFTSSVFLPPALSFPWYFIIIIIDNDIIIIIIDLIFWGGLKFKSERQMTATSVQGNKTHER